MLTIATISRSKRLLAVLVTAAALLIAGTTYGYASLSKNVTLSLDGQASEVDAIGSTVADILDSENIQVSDRDLVTPSLDSTVTDGTRISVRFARELELSVDGNESTYWVHATSVNGALAQIGKRFLGAELSASRGSSIGRDGLALSVVTPKVFRLQVAGGKQTRRELAVLTVKDVLDELKVPYDSDDIIRPALDTELQDGDKIVLDRIRIITKRLKETIDFETVKTTDASMYEDESTTKREGVNGLRDVTYRLTYRNGEIVARKVVKSAVLREPVAELVTVGTKERPAETNFASGSTVWDRLAQCESGGNWAINTGNGYYGGLQFSLSTWRSYGGAGYPHEQSREYQIMIAERVRDATGGYGSWPACAAELGLPT